MIQTDQVNVKLAYEIMSDLSDFISFDVTSNFYESSYK